MKIPIRYEPARVTLAYFAKWALDHVQVVERNGKALAIASDGREFVQLPVTLEEGDKPGIYPVAAFRSAREGAIRNLSDALDDRVDYEDHVPTLQWAMQQRGQDATLRLLGDGVASDGEVEFRSKTHDRHFPEFPTEKRPSGIPLAVVTLDARRLLNLALALGAEVQHDMVAVSIEIHGSEDVPIVVRPSPEDPRNPIDGAVGYLMPISPATFTRAIETGRGGGREPGS